jgi:hypothetical protein
MNTKALRRRRGVGALLSVGLALAPAAALMCGGPALAHHSTAMFEWGKESTIQGTVQDFQWTQPHTWIDVLVSDPQAPGGSATYGIEGMSPSYLARVGWNKRSLNPGDKVTMTIYPLKDGRKGGFCVRVKFADGHVLQHVPQRNG